MLNFAEFSVALNVTLLVVAGFGIYIAGSRLSAYADVIAERTGLGHAFVGMLLLAVATSLPEIATTITGAAGGRADIVTSNLMGGVALQTTVLALVDWVAVRGALTFFAPKPALLLQGVLLITLLLIVLTGAAVGELVSVRQVGLWSVVLFGLYLLTLYLVHQYQRSPRWEPAVSDDDRGVLTERERSSGERQQHARRQYESIGSRHLYGLFAVGALVVLIAGWTVIQASEALADRTGVSGSFVGATLVAITTSLPEFSTTLGAARLGNYTLAISNIFGSNTLMAGIFLLADVFYREGPILNTFGASTFFLTALGALTTCAYVWGLIERRNRSVLGMGLDSLVVVALYLGGIMLTFTLSTSSP